MKAMTVADVMQATGLSRMTLRYYEKMGLLKPKRMAANGYRIYESEDLERLEFIFRTKKAGFTIREIRGLLDLKKKAGATCRLGQDMANEQIRRIDDQISALQDVRSTLAEFAAECESVGLDEPCSLSFSLKPVLIETPLS